MFHRTFMGKLAVRAWGRTAAGVGVLVLALAGCEESSGTPGPDLPPFERLVAAMGGEEALLGLRSITAQASGERYLHGEGFEPGSPAFRANTFTTNVTFDLDREGLRIDRSAEVGFLGFVRPLGYSEIISGDRGTIVGNDSISGFPSTSMTSLRLAATVREQTLLHPELIVRRGLMGGAAPEVIGSQVFGDRLYDLVELADDVAPITLWIDSLNGRLSKLTTLDTDMLRGDKELTVHFADWRPAAAADPAAAPTLPFHAALSLGDVLLHTERRDSSSVNGGVPEETFALGASPAPFIQAHFDRGLRSTELHQEFASGGMPHDALQLTVAATQVAPGVHHLTGGSHHSLAIEQANGLVIVEAPLYPERGQAIVDWAAAAFPGKPITHVISTHHHSDHSAGLRALVAAGATVVASEHGVALYDEVFRSRRTLLPDALAARPVPAQIVGVPDGGSFTIPDAVRPVTTFHAASSHARDLLFAYVPDGKVVFVSDVYTPGQPPFPPLGAEFHRALIDAVGREVNVIAGGHGGTATLQELEAAMKP